MARAARCRAFSLIELVIVVVIMGIIGAIAIPRMGQRVARSRVTALVTTTLRVQEAIDRYTAEHEGRDPAHDQVGSLNLSGLLFIKHLTRHSTILGNLDINGIYGPYITRWPLNTANGLRTVRIDGAAAGANTHGWHYAVDQQLFLPDDDTIGGVIPSGDGGTGDMQ